MCSARDGEIGELIANVTRFDFDRRHARFFWAHSAPRDERVDVFALRECFNRTVAKISHPTDEPESLRFVTSARAVRDTLNHATNVEANTFHDRVRITGPRS